MQDVQFAASETTFSDISNIPTGTTGHFSLHFYAVVARILVRLGTTGTGERNDTYFEQFPFLGGYQSMLGPLVPDGVPATQGTWWDAQIASLEAQTAEHLPIRALVAGAGLSMDEVRVLIATGLVEEDIRFGALFAALQEPLVARRPCIGVLTWLLSDPGGETLDGWSTTRSLLDAGLLQVENRADPRAEWLLRVPPAAWDALRGRPQARPAPGITLQLAAEFPALDDLILPEAVQARILHVPELLSDGRVAALVLRGMTGSGRRTTLGAVAREVKRDVLLWESGTTADENWRLLGPLATLVGAMPILRCEPGPGETVDLPMLPGYSGPVGITLGRSGGLRGPLIAHSLSLNLPPPDQEARHRFWQATRVPVEVEALDEIVKRFLLTGGHIHRTASLSQAYAALENRQRINVSDVQQATRALNRQALETLATHLDPLESAELVIGSSTSSEMRTLEARCYEREALRELAGRAFSNNLTRGVRALFSGPSGTGKTLAARVLAAKLQMDLYRVDLSAVVNKYIGETERNLNQ
ncbi:MAG TPA: AAA family ATPase, partial [Ktedonobacteraceae bacterium]